jgi:hypothetical protein
MPNPDGSLNWNDPGFVSNLQNYQNLGGDMNRAAEYLYAGAGANDPTQTSKTTQDRIRNMSAPETEWQKMQNLKRDQGFASGFLASSGYNPGGANSYLISNSVGLNSGNPAGQYINSTGNGYTSTNPNATPVTATTPTGTTPETRGGSGSTIVDNSLDLNKNRTGMFKRGNAGGYSNGAQYYQTASLPGGLGGSAGSGYGGLGYSSANSGAGWGGGNNWNKAIWR